MTGGGGDKRFVFALKRAVSEGDFTTAKRLIKGGVEINNPLFWFDGTLLHEAVATGNESMVELLLQAGASVNAQDKADRNSLHLACRHGFSLIVQQLVSANADVNAQTKDGRTCLHIAIWRGYRNIAQCLLKAGANANRQDEDGWTPLHWAAKSGMLEVTQMLMDRGAKLDVQDKNGRTPLHESFVHVHADVMTLLLSRGADPNIHPKVGSSLSILLGSKSCTHEAVFILLSHGYNVPGDQWLHEGRLPQTLPSNIRTLILARQSCVDALSQLCRTAVRRRLRGVNGGKDLTQLTSLLPLPQLLQEFLLYAHQPKH